MEGLVLFFLLLILVLIIAPFVALAKASDAQRRADDLAARINLLEAQIRRLEGRAGATPETVHEQPVIATKPARFPPPPSSSSTPPEIKHAPLPVPPLPTERPKSPLPAEQPVERKVEKPSEPVREQPAEAPPVRFRLPVAPSPRPASALDLEQFMGGKMLAWIGGLTLFLGVGFFVKYSFDHNLISPAMRATIGFIVGAGLVLGGVCMRRRETVVTAQTLCATGVLVLYAVTYACRSFYQFPFFEVVPTFTIMAAITALAFVLAVHMNALVVAVLGLAGGFLTPVLISTGQDAPLALFGYIALLDVGLLAVALRKRWNALPVLGAIGTGITQVGWVGAFFVENGYAAENRVFVALAVFGGSFALFLAAVALARKLGRASEALAGSALALGGLAFAFTAYLLYFDSLAQRPALLFGYLFLIDLGLLGLVVLAQRFAGAEGEFGLGAFVLLFAWTNRYLSNAHLAAALAFYFIFALLHSAAPMMLQRLRKIGVPGWGNAFPAIALALVLLPIARLPEPSLLVWPFVLLVNALAIGVAVLTTTMVPILVVLMLTLVALGSWMSRIPATLAGLPAALWLIAGFAIFFTALATWASRRLARPGDAGSLFGDASHQANLALQIPVLSAALPFLLLITATLHMPLTNPTPIFGVALLLVVMLLALSRFLALDALPAIALGATLALEYGWHNHHFSPDLAGTLLAWNLGFYALFTVYPFAFHRRLMGKTSPWAVAALSGPLHFTMVYQVIKIMWPNPAMGLLPAAFAVPALFGLAFLQKRTPAESPGRLAQIAWFGGSALFFITLIFPIQFGREWLTISWALEGAALCWLFRRVPHPGLRLTGIGLLVTAFVRLALNPAVLSYHPRAAAGIFNWYLYAYGVVVVALFTAAWLLAPPRNIVRGYDARPFLYTLGTVLAFLLVNIEVADFFSAQGTPVLTFQFFGNFARDMSYSIAWALFALTLLIVGIRRKLVPVRFASLGLLGATVAKLFLHDLSQLDQLYRIGAFVAVAIVAILASFLYQRFVVVLTKEPGET